MYCLYVYCIAYKVKRLFLLFVIRLLVDVFFFCVYDDTEVEFIVYEQCLLYCGPFTASSNQI